MTISTTKSWVPDLLISKNISMTVVRTLGVFICKINKKQKEKNVNQVSVSVQSIRLPIPAGLGLARSQTCLAWVASNLAFLRPISKPLEGPRALPLSATLQRSTHQTPK